MEGQAMNRYRALLDKKLFFQLVVEAESEAHAKSLVTNKLKALNVPETLRRWTALDKPVQLVGRR